MNRFLATLPFDLYELALFQLVVRHRSFTKAAEAAGLTQSAVTRQMQGVEHSLGVALLERSTRTVRPTEAGEYLYQEASRLLGDVDRTMEHLAREFAGARKEIRVSVSTTIALAYLPGFFHANLRQFPQIAYRVASLPSAEILSQLEANHVDIGVLSAPARLPRTLRVTHRFADAFTLILPKAMESQLPPPLRKVQRREFLRQQTWLLIGEHSVTGQQLRQWMKRRGLEVESTMELDNFDLIIHLVAMGLGVSIVPMRALALYNRKGKILRVAFEQSFTRDLVVVTRKLRKMPEHLGSFINRILF